MNLINTILGTPLGYIMYICYAAVKNYGAAIILFTLFSKIILFPISLMAQKNSIRLVKVKPQLDEIKLRYAGDKDRIADEQIKLYDNQKYSPALGCLPTLLQIPLILGLINVIYNPLQHLLHIPKQSIEQLTARAAEIARTLSLGMGTQLHAIDIIRNPSNIAAFESLRGTIPDFDGVIQSIRQMSLSFMGINLGATPSFTDLSVLTMIPVLSGLTCLVMCLIQNKINVLQREQGPASQWGMTVFLVAFSTYFPFVVPAGVGIYWIFSNLFSILVMVHVNMVYNPNNLIDYANRPKKHILTKEENLLQRNRRKENRVRENADYKRFYSKETESKQLVFYSAKSGFYKYFEYVIKYILDNSDITLHYVTSDPDDAIFKLHAPKIVPYYIGEKRLIPFMMKMDADMVVMTMPDLQKYHIKRSLVRKDIEYVYMFHHISSVHMVLREGALDHYDTILCVGPHQFNEIRKTEEVYNLPEKRLVKCGYGLIDNMTEQYDSMPPNGDEIRQILIAPSWQADNIIESCIDPLLENLFNLGCRIIVRPHPEMIKRFPLRIESFLKRYDSLQNDCFRIETDFSSNETIYQSDILITDWSNIAFEFSFATKKPTVFINTPMKVMNLSYMDIGITPSDIILRDLVGVSVEPDQIERVPAVIKDMLRNSSDYRAKIENAISEYMYNQGCAAQVGGQYIVEALERKGNAILHE